MGRRTWPEPRRTAAQLRTDVIAQYASKDRHDNPRFCTATQDELSAGEKTAWTSDGKVIYPDLDTATQAGIAMQLVSGGPKQRAYMCPRSTSGHAHLSSGKGERPWTGD